MSLTNKLPEKIVVDTGDE